MLILRRLRQDCCLILDDGENIAGSRTTDLNNPNQPANAAYDFKEPQPSGKSDYSRCANALEDLNFSDVIRIAASIPWWNEATVNAIKFWNDLFLAAWTIYNLCSPR